MVSKKDDIVEAAKNLLWQVGYESMSPRMVLKASGAGQGSMYHHFETKADLSAYALEEIERELTEEFDAVLASQADPIDKITAYLKVKRDGVNGCRLGRLANEQSVLEGSLRVPIARYFKHVEHEIERVLIDAQQAGRLDDTMKAKDIATAIVAVVQGGFALSRINGNSAKIRQASRGALVLLEHAVKPDTGA
ncbi:TetR/AcrR family transcriptional regulator [Thalassospiraceae bacterium LMO-JJ14]|nr:TetR/AcrR family transcriptional regulator [Thalassospiraceae bacterium LMO-JJ14]